MPQLQLPMFPSDVTNITQDIAFCKQEGRVIYYTGLFPIFSHDEKDINTFRMITSQFIVNGNARERDIIKAFGVTKISVMRGVKLYREKGAAGFYEPRRTRGPAVLTPSVIEAAQGLFNEGKSASEVAKVLSLKADTVRKAIAAKKLFAHSKKKSMSQMLPQIKAND